MAAPRPSSSVYTDPFELDELFTAVSDGQHEAAIQSLVYERDSLRRDLTLAREIWSCIYKVLAGSAQIATKMSHVYKNAQERVNQERGNWLANCTAF
jgi:hypothetical protein